MSIGGKVYSQSAARYILTQHNSKNATKSLAAQLVGVKLGIAYGSDAAPIAATVLAADVALAKYGYGGSYPNGAKAGLIALKDKLDAYNNGLLTPGCKTW